MTNLQYRKEKIKEKRKQTPWREFVREIASWMPIGLQKNRGNIARYPEARMSDLVGNEAFAQQRTSLLREDSLHGKHFFDSFATLWQTTPFSQTIQQGKNENTDFADSVLNSKNVYLSFGVFESCSDICYSVLVTNNCHTIFNSVQVTNYSEHIYHSAAVDKSSFIFYSKFILNSHHLYFCSNMVGCQECIGCDGLENQSYCINNRQYEKEEYIIKKDEILSEKATFADLEGRGVKGKNLNSSNVVGSGILFSDDIENGYYVMRAHTGRNLIFVTGENDDSNLYDCCDCGINGVDFYGVQGGGTNANNYYCSSQCESCSEIYYSYYLYNCSFCLGCIGLQNQQYCIFNKQYTKEERYKKVDEIFSQMGKDGTLGNFFPGSLNPFYFNDTAAYLIDESFTKEEVEKGGYLRRDEPIKVDIPERMEVVDVKDLGQYEGRRVGTQFIASASPEAERRIDPAILKKVIRDEEGNVYRVIKMEYDFLMKYGLPLPRKHWLQRLKGHFRVK